MDVRHGVRHLVLAFPRRRFRSTSTPTNSLSTAPPWECRTVSTLTSTGADIGRVDQIAAQVNEKATRDDQVPGSSPSSTATDEFLELEDDEYHRVILPRRQPKPFVVPWPTLLPPHDAENDFGTVLNPNPSSSMPSTALPPRRREPVVYLPSAAKVTLAEVKEKRHQGIVTTPCEVLFQAVQTAHWEDADKLLCELEDLGIPIRADRVYARGAIHALRASVTPWIPTTDPDHPSVRSRSLALRYLSHCPVDTSHYRIPKPIIDAYRPIVYAALENNHTSDLQFTEHLLLLCASKGLTGMSLATGLFKTWLARVDNERGYRGVNVLIEQAAAAIGISLVSEERSGGTARRTMTKAEIRSRAGLKMGAFKLRNSHLRSLVGTTVRKLQRAVDESSSSAVSNTTTLQDPAVIERMAEARRDLDFAKRIFVSGQRVGIVWEERTKLAMLQALKTYPPDQAVEPRVRKPHAVQQDHPDPVGYLTASVMKRESKVGGPQHETTDRTTLAGKQVLQVIHARANGPIKALADVLVRLEARGDRQSLLKRIRDRFIDSPPEPRRHAPWKVSETTRSYWYMAQVGKLERQQRLGEAIALFKREFLWIGLPRLKDLRLVQPVPDPAPAIRKGSVRTTSKLYPSDRAVTGIMHVILANLERPDGTLLAGLHERYIHSVSKVDQHDDPTPVSTTLNPTSHIPFIMAMTKWTGPHKTEAYLRDLEARGISPGVPSWTAVATDYARLGYSHRAMVILAEYQSGLDTPAPVDPQRRARKGPTRTTSRVGNTRMFLAVAAMHFRTGRREQARQVISLMRGRKMPSSLLARNRLKASRQRRAAEGHRSGSHTRQSE